MAKTMQHYENIDEYIANFPEKVQARLRQMRETIAAAAPGAKDIVFFRVAQNAKKRTQA